MSCEGEPAPNFATPVVFPRPFIIPVAPKADLKAPLVGGSIGEVFAVEEPDRG